MAKPRRSADHGYNTRTSPKKAAIEKSRQAKGRESKAARQRTLDERRLKTIDFEQKRLEKEKAALNKRSGATLLNVDEPAGTEDAGLPPSVPPLMDFGEQSQGERRGGYQAKLKC